jgi:hypothetical protein
MGKESKKELYQYGGKKEYYQLRHSGLYKINPMLKKLKKELENHEYTITDKEHSEGVKPSGKEIVIEWKCQRKVNDYVKFEIDLVIRILRQIDVMMEKKKIQKGDFEFRLTSFVEKNYKKTFKDKGFGEIQRHIYEKFIIPNRLGDYEDRVLEESTDILNIVKENLI